MGKEREEGEHVAMVMIERQGGYVVMVTRGSHCCVPSLAAGGGCPAVCGGSPRGSAGETATADTLVRM